MSAASDIFAFFDPGGVWPMTEIYSSSVKLPSFKIPSNIHFARVSLRKSVRFRNFFHQENGFVILLIFFDRKNGFQTVAWNTFRLVDQNKHFFRFRFSCIFRHAGFITVWKSQSNIKSERYKSPKKYSDVFYFRRWDKSKFCYSPILFL